MKYLTPQRFWGKISANLYLLIKEGGEIKMKKLFGIVLGTMVLALLVTGCKKQAPAPEMQMPPAATEATPAETPAAQ